MIRIQTTDTSSGSRIVVDGQLAGENIAELETSVTNAMRPQKSVHLFLRNVSHIDEAARSLLCRMAGSGVELTATGVYSSYVVAEIQRSLSSSGTRE